jgi:hypothetical protein
VVTGLLVQYAPDPTRLVFAVLGALFVTLIVLTVAALPETVQHVPGGLAALRPSVAVPPLARRAFAGAVPAMVAAWALGGLVLSIGGSLLVAVFDQPNHALAGLVIGMFPLSAGSAAVLGRDVAPPPAVGKPTRRAAPCCDRMEDDAYVHDRGPWS